jgi:hypothetical protein
MTRFCGSNRLGWGRRTNALLTVLHGSDCLVIRVSAARRGTFRSRHDISVEGEGAGRGAGKGADAGAA